MSEPAALKVFEHSLYVGSYLSGILYGINLIVYFAIVRAIVGGPNRGLLRRKAVYAALSTTFMFLVTIDIISNAFWGEQMWITFRDRPGGVPQFIADESAVWYQTLGTTSAIAMILLADALLIYRLFVFYDGNIAVIVLPIIAWLAGFALAVIQLVLAGAPNGSIFEGQAHNFGISYYTITIAFNILLTPLIMFRLHRMGKVLTRIMGQERSSVYIGFSAMMVESAATYSIFGFMFLIPYVVNAGTAAAFAQVWGKMACFFPLMIILRIVTKKAWTRQLVAQARSSAASMSGETTSPDSGSSHDHTNGPASTEKDWDSAHKSVV